MKNTSPPGQASPKDTPRRPGRRHSIGFGWRLAFRSRGGRARGFLRVWTVWQWLSHLVLRHHPIPDAPYHLFEIQFARYHGKPITLPDGPHVKRGDRVAIVHVNNRVISGPVALLSPWQQLRMMRGDLRALARWSAMPDFPPDIRALYGYTLLSRGASRLGFVERARPSTWWTRLNAFFLTGLLVIYTPSGRERLQRGTTYGTEPSETWMSLGELRRRYGKRQGDDGE
jgi:peptidoglycan-N-acetylglucosamine deacetylase